MEFLLKPMPKDALLRREPAASAPPSLSPLLREKPSDPECLRKPEFAPLPVRRAEPAQEETLDDLLAPYLTDDDDDDPAEDAVPTHLMPVPVCVPLYEEPQTRRRGRR